jgi:hypothetical protein
MTQAAWSDRPRNRSLDRQGDGDWRKGLSLAYQTNGYGLPCTHWTRSGDGKTHKHSMYSANKSHLTIISLPSMYQTIACITILPVFQKKSAAS